MHLREVLSLCARLLQETLRCFPYAVSFLHYCQFTYVCLSSLLSSLPSKQQELHQHPLQGRAQVSSEALKGFLNLDGTFLSNYFFLYCLTQDQGTFVPQSQVLRALQKPGYLPCLFKSRRVASLIDCKPHLLGILYKLKWASVIQIS